MKKNNNLEREHSWVSPSGLAPVMLGCVAKPALEKGFPNRTNKAAEAGTLSHAHMEHRLKLILNLPTEEPKDICPHPDLVDLFVRTVLDYKDKDGVLHVETKVDVVTDLDISGHVDVIIHNTDSIYVCDLKTGLHTVEAENNYQLMAYALGFIKTLQNLPKEFIVVLVIVQNNKVDWWATTVEELYIFEKELTEKAARAKILYSDEKLVTIEDCKINYYCKWCRAKLDCPIVKVEIQKELNLSFVDESLPVIPPKAINLSNDVLVRVAKASSLVESFIEECKEELKNRLSDGQIIEGVELGSKKGSRKWDLTKQKEIEYFLESNGIEPYKKSLIGFTELKKLNVPDDLMEPIEEIKMLKINKGKNK